MELQSILFLNGFRLSMKRSYRGNFFPLQKYLWREWAVGYIIDPYCSPAYVSIDTDIFNK